MSYVNLEAPRIGTVATLKPYKRVDGRSCFRCGARAGQCEDLQADEDIVWMSSSKERPVSPARVWGEKEREYVRFLFIEGGLSNAQIAEVVNTTEGAIAGVLHRMGVRRG